MKTNKRAMIKNYWKPVTSIGVVAALAAGGAFAYFTDTKSATNTFDIADTLHIELHEDVWDSHDDENNNGIPDIAENMVPLQTVAKDPAVENTSEDIASYAFLQVKVPRASVTTVDETTGIADTQEMVCDLFKYSINEGWTELSSESDDAYTTRTYAFDSVLDAKDKTNPLFSEVTLINLTEKSASTVTGEQQIIVNAYGIQSSGFKSASAAWNAYATQNKQA